MKIVADSKIPLVGEAFANLGEVVMLDTQQITAAAVREADSLLIRSETKVDHALLHSSRIQFVGTSTIGTDHVDTDYLQQQGIGFASAPGSNANSVAEYIVAALLVLAKRMGFSLEGKTLGVVGIGNIGRIVVKYARALGMNVLQNDPPLARVSGDPSFLPLDELMDADIVTLHVPLTKTSPDKTYHRFDEKRIRQMKSGSILINTSRGAVVETNGLKQVLRANRLAACVLDVWENEPAIDTELLSLATLGSPHIAGYSYDGKINGTVMLHRALCEHSGLQSAWKASRESNIGTRSPITIPRGLGRQRALLAAVSGCYDIEDDDRNMRKLLTLVESERATYFRRLRAGYPVRREFRCHEVTLEHYDASLVATLQTLGFQTITNVRQ